MLSENKREIVRKIPKKINKVRLKNIALYYLKRFETSKDNLKMVLRRRIDSYAYYDKNFDKSEAYLWVDELLDDFVRLRYVDDTRFAEIKVRAYLAAGKSKRYIAVKLKEKGIDEILIDKILQEQDYNAFDAALRLAKKKKIGPYSPTADIRYERRTKDLAILVRAGFDYDTVIRVLEMENENVVC